MTSDWHYKANKLVERAESYRQIARLEDLVSSLKSDKPFSILGLSLSSTEYPELKNQLVSMLESEISKIKQELI